MSEADAPAPDRATEMAALEAAILDAHARSDGSALADLYARAARSDEALGKTDAACFFYTQALVFALEAGSAAADDYAAILRRHGRF